ncbi:MAG: DNA replication protein [Alphaproteobacteria bacterium]|nr:DNA replication protein [Alphaproteobacteria bacterium]
MNIAESPLSWLRARRDKAGKPLINDVQFVAGEKLRTDYERSMLVGRVTSNWDASATVGRSSRNTAADLSDSAYAARQRFHKALDSVGPELAGILVQICCLSAGIEQAERLLGLPQRSGKAVLGLALTGLARHYGLLRDGARVASGRTSHWGLPDYRPGIAALEDA